MKYSVHTPCERLRPYVRRLVISETDGAGFYPILPDTGLVMGFQYAGRLAYLQDDETHPLATAGITGLLDGYRLFQNVAGTGTVLVVFCETGLPAFVRQPVHELFDLSLSLEHFFPRQAISDTQERLAEARGDAERLQVVEQFLLERLSAFDPDPLVAGALSSIYGSGGTRTSGCDGLSRHLLRSGAFYQRLQTLYFHDPGRVPKNQINDFLQYRAGGPI